eukprot:scaffold60895_cov63-Phaeocystis_antarctica.AAC.7
MGREIASGIASVIASEIDRGAPRAARACPASSAPGGPQASGASGASASRRRRPGKQVSGGESVIAKTAPYNFYGGGLLSTPLLTMATPDY